MTEASPQNIVPGILYNNEFIQALSYVISRHGLMSTGQMKAEMIVDKQTAMRCSQGLFPPIFHKYKDRGIYCFRLFIAARPIFVLVDSRIPV